MPEELDEGAKLEQALVDAAGEETPEVVEETPEVIETEDELTGEAEVNPWKTHGFENEEEFGDFVQGARESKNEVDQMRAELDAYKAGVATRDEPAPADDGRTSQYPFVGYDAKDYEKEEVQDTVNGYAVEFFRSPKDQIIDLIADDVEHYVNTRIAEALQTRDTSARVDSRKDYLTENSAQADALREKFPGASDDQILTILETVMPEKQTPEVDPNDARAEDARGVNTETGKAPRTGPSKSRQSFSEIEDEAEQKFMNKISRLVD